MRAPELRGRRWLNTGGAELSLADLRGKIVLLDFWTFCCVNCLHVLDELRELEERYADVLVTIGVHSPKFAHEADPDAVAAAVERYAVHHPVLDDPELLTWDAYAARAWPTLVVIDPRGYVVAQMSGEGHAHGLAVLIEELLAEHVDVLRRGDGPYVAPPEAATALRFPGKVIALPDGGFLVSDTAHHQLVELEPDLVTERRRIGTGERGSGRRRSRRDSTSRWGCSCSRTATCWSPTASTTPCAGSGWPTAPSPRWRAPAPSSASGSRRERPRPSCRRRGTWPGGTGASWWRWRATTSSGRGTRLPVRRPRGRAPPTRDCATARPPRRSSPSPRGSRSGDGVLWVADAETSALREVRAGLVATAVGQGLFDFGHRDGPADEALFQHPLGVAVLPDGSVAVADTYNGAVRRYDPATRTVSTLAADLAEPSDVLVDGDTLVVVESAAHRLVRLPLPASVAGGRGARSRCAGRPPTSRPATSRCGWRSSRPPVSTSTPGSAIRPSSRCRPPRRSCWSRARAQRRGCPGSSCSATCPRGCCRSASRRPRATRATGCSPPATATSRTGASRCGSWTGAHAELVLDLRAV